MSATSGGGLVGEGGVQGRFQPAGGVLADRSTGVCGQAPCLLDEDVDDAVLLSVQLSQQIPVEGGARGAKTGSELQQWLDLRPPGADEGVRQPRHRRRLAEPADISGQASVAGSARLLLPLRSRGNEVFRRQSVELVGDAVEIHPDILPPRCSGDAPAVVTSRQPIGPATVVTATAVPSRCRRHSTTRDLW
jgi:hypothetical protein